MKKLTIVIAFAAILILIFPAVNAAVFIEVATASYCPDCPAASEALYSLYSKGELPFYYVMMVGDKNDFAYQRIKNDYNFYWYPTAFVDGGYKVVLEANEEAYRKAIEESMVREKPNIDIEVNASWVRCSCQKQGLYIQADMRNDEETPYKGTLRIYVTEINSRWDDYSANQYHFAFLNYALVGNISLQPHESQTVSLIWEPPSNFSDIDREDENNLAVFAVLFNATAHEGYANPPSSNPFKAYYVDAVAAFVPWNSPPSVAIVSPKEGYLYIFDREILKIRKTVIIGRKNVEIKALDENGIDRVEIFVDGELRATLQGSYSWVWKDFGKHLLEVKAYDATGYNATDSVEAFIIA